MFLSNKIVWNKIYFRIILYVSKCGLKVFTNLSKPPLVFPKRMLQEKKKQYQKKGRRSKEAQPVHLAPVAQQPLSSLLVVFLLCTKPPDRCHVHAAAMGRLPCTALLSFKPRILASAALALLPSHPLTPPLSSF
jgi:hypothetical protein